MDFQNVRSSFDIRETKFYFPVDTAGSQEGGVEGAWTIRGEHDFDIAPGIESVELGDQFEHCSLDFVISAGAIVESGSADGIDFVEEDDAGFFRPGHFEEFSDHAGSFADISC